MYSECCRWKDRLNLKSCLRGKLLEAQRARCEIGRQMKCIYINIHVLGTCLRKAIERKAKSYFAANNSFICLIWIETGLACFKWTIKSDYIFRLDYKILFIEFNLKFGIDAQRQQIRLEGFCFDSDCSISETSVNSVFRYQCFFLIVNKKYINTSNQPNLQFD